MTIMVTDKAEIKQVKSGLWITIENLLIGLNNGRLLFVPRGFLTDNITFISCDFADVRAAHAHDVGCRFGEQIYLKKDISIVDLRKQNYLVYRNGGLRCADLPLEILESKPIGFHENNKLFKECLQACGENKIKTNIMYGAVHLNIGWWLTKKQKLDFNNFYKEW